MAHIQYGAIDSNLLVVDTHTFRGGKTACGAVQVGHE
jgi:hypothetical protein